MEGNELDVLQGCSHLIKEGQIKNIIYEDFAPWKGPVPQFLQSLGYSIYAIRKGWFGLKLAHPANSVLEASWEEPNFLATRLSLTELRTIERKGYTCLTAYPKMAEIFAKSKQF